MLPSSPHDMDFEELCKKSVKIGVPWVNSPSFWASSQQYECDLQVTPKGFLTYMLSKGSLDDQLQEDCQYLGKTGLLAMQETNNCSYLLYRGRICSSCKLLCSVPSWEQFGTNIASALVGLATNQKFNFSLMILNGMLGHISNGTPFLMYPRFVQLFLDKQLDGVDRPQDFIPSVSLPFKVFTFMRNHSPTSSGCASSARAAQGTPPTQVFAHARIPKVTAGRSRSGNSQGTRLHYKPVVKHLLFGGTVRRHIEKKSIRKKSDDTEEINVRKIGSNVKKWRSEELDLEAFQKVLLESRVPLLQDLNFEEEAVPSRSPIWSNTNIEPEEQFESR
ncbi:hypothetical protein Tco_1385151 [Tanacetum coccineum]